MKNYIKDPQTSIFIGPTGYGKTNRVLGFKERYLYKSFSYITILWVWKNDNVWLVKPKPKLFEWINTRSKFLASENILLIINDIIADKSLEKLKQSLGTYHLRLTPESLSVSSYAIVFDYPKEP